MCDKNVCSCVFLVVYNTLTCVPMSLLALYRTDICVTVSLLGEYNTFTYVLVLCWSYAPYFWLGVFNTIQHLCARVIVGRVQHSYLCPRAVFVGYTIITICVLVHLIGVFNTAMCNIVSLLVVYNTAIWISLLCWSFKTQLLTQL